jgi:hypothetical protein
VYLEYSPAAIVHYLLGRGWLEVGDLFAGAVVLVPMGRLNSTFKLYRHGAPHLFFKQAAPRPDPAASGIAREAAFLSAAAAHPPLAGFVPRLLEHDAARGIVLLELYPADDASLLPPLDGMAGLGRALAALHRHGGALQPAVEGFTPRFTHWALQVHRRPLMRHQNAGQKELYGLLLRTPELVDALSAFEPLWEFDGLMHGDAKWDNCVYTPAQGADAARVRLADWESVRPGDFAWDVAGVFQDLWIRWIASMPLAASSAPEPDTAEIPLESVAAAARAFWDAYRADAGIGGADAERCIDKAVRFAAARMVQTASEQSGELGYVGYSPLALMQFAHNLALRPDEARAGFLGF